MTRRLKHTTSEDVENIRIGIAMLRKARDLFAKAGAPKTARRVRLALTSAGGAERHVYHRLARTERGT